MHSTATSKRKRRYTLVRDFSAALFIAALYILVPFSGICQNVSISVKNANLEKVFRQIEKQTLYRFVYAKETLEDAHPVSIEAEKASLQQVLNTCFTGQPLTYSITDNIIMIKAIPVAKTEIKTTPAYNDVSGRITNEQGELLAGATVSIKGTQQATATDLQGTFTLKNVSREVMLIISNIGYNTQIVPMNGKTLLFITLTPAINTLDETVVIGYGNTTRRFNTGNVGHVTAEDISKQPVSNPLAALQGRVPGLLITQKSGLPGSSFNVQLRGINSLKQGTQPLFIIDGMPLMLNSGSLSQLAPDVQSLLNTINPSDIESIEVLKDADATAIYGSQGANGVVLITTKKSKEGKTKLDINAYTGIGKPSRLVNLLSTSQYLQVRREAFTNDGVIPSVSNAPDLIVWDTTRYTDWQKFLIGGSAKTTNIQASLSGGNAMTSFLLSGNYYAETTVFPNAKPAIRVSSRLNLNHVSSNKNFTAQLNTVFSADYKNQPFADLTGFILLPPNAPSLYDSSGKLNWVSGIENPMSYLFEKYKSETVNYLNNASLSYRVTHNVAVKLNAGYNNIQFSEQKQTPIKAQRPSSSTYGYLQLASGTLKSWVIEPQLQYKKATGIGSVEVIAGLSFQQRIQAANNISGSGITSDDLIGNISSASQSSTFNSISQYSYEAFFGRVNYNLHNKYIVNLNVRRDGSSRFGPTNRFSNFGAIGGAWLITEEAFAKKFLPFVSFAKLRGSYGITGNDQIGDYQYVDSWSASSTNLYGGAAGLLPTRLYNGSYQWERNAKLEAGLEISFLKEAIFASLSYYRNRSNNQLVSYKLPSQTGFTTIVQNLDALVQNKGLEIEINTRIYKRKEILWQVSMNMTIPETKLLRYPGLESSSDKLNFAIGEPLSIIRTYNYLRVNPETGVYSFEDIDKDGRISSPNDLTNITFIGPEYYGGLQNQLTYKKWNLSVFLQFNKQKGRNYLTNLTSRPGLISNQPEWVMGRWQKPGDISLIQRFTTTSSNTAFTAYGNYRNSSALADDASFVRLKNISISYTLSEKFLKKLPIQGLQFFLKAQNLITITKYKGSDPETQSLLSLPPLQILTAGIQTNL